MKVTTREDHFNLRPAENTRTGKVQELMPITTTNSWIDVLSNSIALTSLFDKVPMPRELMSVEFHRQGPTAKLTFDLDLFPPRPPRGWAKEYNTVQCTLRLDGMTEVSFSQFGYDNPITEFLLTNTPNGLHLSVGGTGVALTIAAQHADILNISGYCRT